MSSPLVTTPVFKLMGIAIGNAPAEYGYSLRGDVGYASGNPQFLLYVSPAAYWNGSTTTGGGAVAGGTGTWDVAAATTNWTDSTGSAAAAYAQNASVVFAGTAGTVTVSGSTAPEVVGMKFLTSGYLVTGGEIKLAATTGQTNADFNVQDATLASGGTATIASCSAERWSGQVGAWDTHPGGRQYLQRRHERQCGHVAAR